MGVLCDEPCGEPRGDIALVSQAKVPTVYRVRYKGYGSLRGVNTGQASSSCPLISFDQESVMDVDD